MRKNIVAGNWKMNTTLQEGLELAKGLDAALKGKAINCDVVIGTPFTHLASIAAAIDTNKIGVATDEGPLSAAHVIISAEPLLRG